MQTVMIYDGFCALCMQSLRMIKPLDWRHAIEYMNLQEWDAVKARYPQLDYDALMGAVHVVLPDGSVLAGYQGVRELLRRLPLTGWMYPILKLPGIAWLGDKAYKWVAAHRYQFNRIFGGPTECVDGVCKVHTK